MGYDLQTNKYCAFFDNLHISRVCPLFESFIDFSCLFILLNNIKLCSSNIANLHRLSQIIFVCYYSLSFRRVFCSEHQFDSKQRLRCSLGRLSRANANLFFFVYSASDVPFQAFFICCKTQLYADTIQDSNENEWLQVYTYDSQLTTRK